MTGGSLRLRLAAAGAAAVLAALAVAALGLELLFERHVERRAAAELSARLDQLAAGLDVGPDGAVVVARPPADPRYVRPLSGLYWQVTTPTGDLRSRSLWDYVLPLGATPLAGGSVEIALPGPGGEPLLALARRLTLAHAGPDATATAAVAMDRAELEAATRAFIGDLAPYLGLLAATLIVAAWVQVSVGLRPLATVGARVAALGSGAAARLGADFPAEVRPLAAEIDALLDARDAELARARARAGDLAHGLKTPLQALIGEAGRLRDAGATEAADGIEAVADAIGRHVERELARARMAGAARAAAADPAAAIARVVDVLRRTPDGARVSWDVTAPPDLRARVDPADLTEALGALLENAARHAATRVAVRVARRGGWVDVEVRDDGPGAPAARLAAMRLRGVRYDAGAPGDGLGLAIAGEIAEAAGGALRLENADPGLAATLELPAAGAAPSAQARRGDRSTG